ncbi:hypothetical protein Godav_011836 [Gossypium davidsonii]|uniref:DUF4378 domain-containing protein n=2 Tax=Gossypium TaxID=3633 RepID=A0A7J8RCN8_GOSDV|nr:hypothetical protein [Gossypium davidsonii]MBA0646234.1 hypothetical protein [Gossypium klotzschianum]
MTLERRPRMLKDFIHDDPNSCSSNGFKSFPRKSTQNSIIFRENPNQKIQRSRSKAASATISAFQAMINVIKSIHFASSSPSILLPITLSRKPSKRKISQNKEAEIKMTVTVKDIIRWKSFRDLLEEKSQPLDFAPSSASRHHHCTTTTTTTGSNTPCSCTTSSNGSSWCDSDFTSEYLPSDEYGENEVDNMVGKKFSPCVGKDTMETTTRTAANTDMGPKHASVEEEPQHSPLSVLDFEYGGDDEDGEEANEIEEKAWELLNGVKQTSPLTRYKNNNICIDKLLLDLFREEMETKWDQTRNIEELEREMVRVAKAWICEEQNEKRGVGDKREECVGDMEREGKWRDRFLEEQEELAMGVERWVMNVLVDELLVDIL